MTEEQTKSIKAMLKSEMVSRVTLEEAINIMHNLAIQEVEENVEKMSDEEKKYACEELTSKVEEAKAENEKVKTEE